MATRLALIEDHPALRKGLGLLLSSRGCEVVGTAGTAEAALELVARCAPEVVIVDVHLGSESGIALTRELVARDPATRVVLYSGSDDDALVKEGLDAGALVYLLKNGEIDELLEGIAAALAGRRHVDPRLRPALAEPRPPALTKRERQVMDLLACGLTGEQVAAKLVLSAETVKTHVRNAMGKLDATTRVHAVALALRDGQIPPPRTYAAARSAK